MQNLTLKNNLTKHNIFSILTPVFSWWSVRFFHTTYKGSFHWKDVRMFILPLRHSPRPYTLIQFIYTGSVCLHHLPDLKDSFVKGLEVRHQSALSFFGLVLIHFLHFHPPVLEPDFNLSLCQVQQASYLVPPVPGEVHIEQKFLFKL